MNTVRSLGMIAIGILLGLGIYALLLKYQPSRMASFHMAPSQVGAMSKNEYDLRRALDKLWSDHVLWTRQYIVSTLANLPDAQEAATRLLKNQDDIGNAIAPYYGSEAGKQLAQLLKDHITIAVDVVKAAMDNNESALKASDEKWHANARDIAEFLSKANPNWPVDMLVEMLNQHLKLTTQEVVLRLKKQWKDDVANFDKIFEQALEMAKALSDGIVAQFADKF